MRQKESNQSFFVEWSLQIYFLFDAEESLEDLWWWRLEPDADDDDDDISGVGLVEFDFGDAGAAGEAGVGVTASERGDGFDDGALAGCGGRPPTISNKQKMIIKIISSVCLLLPLAINAAMPSLCFDFAIASTRAANASLFLMFRRNAYLYRYW